MLIVSSNNMHSIECKEKGSFMNTIRKLFRKKKQETLEPTENSFKENVKKKKRFKPHIDWNSISEETVMLAVCLIFGSLVLLAFILSFIQ